MPDDDKPESPTSLPSLTSSSPQHITDDEDVKELNAPEIASHRKSLTSENDCKLKGSVSKTNGDDDDCVIGPTDSETDDDVTLLDSSGVTSSPNVHETKSSNTQLEAEDTFTHIHTNTKPYSPVRIENLDKPTSSTVGDIDTVPNFNIIPGKAGDCSGRYLI